MNIKFINLAKNFSYAISSNVISLIISAVVTLVVPKVIGIDDYGYWQIYLFYASYVGFLHFGWNDGVYLKLGGENYLEINKKSLHSQFWLLFLSQFIIALLILIGIRFSLTSNDEVFVFSMISMNLLFVNTRIYLIYILQATGRIKDYSKATIIDRIIYILLIIGLLLLGAKSFHLLIFADLIAKCISLVYTMFICKDIVFRSLHEIYFDPNSILDNISIGSRLMFANIASSLILGSVKFGIERNWNVGTFGKVSLTLSVANLLMRFILSLSLVIYPILRNVRKEQLSMIYISIRNALMMFLLGTLIFYYPFKTVLTAWLPEYTDSLEYMALVFPVIVYEGKVGLLSNTFLKTLRKEKMLLVINIVTLIMSVVITILTTVILNNLALAMISIVILIAVKSILSEIVLSKIIPINVRKDIILEFIMTMFFIYTAWNLDSWFSMFSYVIIYLIYIIIKLNDFKYTFKTFKFMATSKN